MSAGRARRSPPTGARRRGARGFVLVAALFVLVIAGLIAGALLFIGSAAATGTTLSLQAVRADAAVQSAVERALAEVIRSGSCFGSPASFTLSGGALPATDVTMTCAQTAVTSEGSVPVNAFRVQVTASRGQAGSLDRAQRRVTVTVVI